jgi:hypothetical protein
MRVICVSDVHGKLEGIKRLKEVEGDLVVISGDITNFGHKERAEEILSEFLKINKVLAVQGNCDYMDVNEALEEADVNLHSQGRIIRGIGFFGVGGSSSTPFNTPQEYSEEEIWNFLEKGYTMITDANIKVLVSHSPPIDTKVDLTPGGVHAGSRKVREFVERYQPQLVVCGHIHEARGEDQIGDATIVNPGPLSGGFVVVDIGEEIRVEFHSL